MNAQTPHKKLMATGAIKLDLDAPKPGPVAKRPFAASSFTLSDPAKIPPRAFVYGRHLIRKQVSVTVAPGGLGKSSLTLVEAMAMATGRPLVGQSVNAPLRVWLWNLEDPREELDRRAAAIAQHFGITNECIGGRLFMDTGREQELCTAVVTGKDGAVLQEPVIDRLIDELNSKRIDVLIVDPFISSHQVSENDNPAMDMVAKAWARVADHANAAISLVHHTRKARPQTARPTPTAHAARRRWSMPQGTFAASPA